MRTIAQPAPAVKELQRWVVKNILKDHPIHESATAYKKYFQHSEKRFRP